MTSESRCVLTVCFPLHPESNLWCHFPYVLKCQTRVYGLFMCLKFCLSCSKFASVKDRDSQYLASQCSAMRTEYLRQLLDTAFDTLCTNKHAPQPWQPALPRQVRVCAHTFAKDHKPRHFMFKTQLLRLYSLTLWAACQHRTSSAWRAPTINLPHIIIQTFIQPKFLESASHLTMVK
jgi:hypothetical protein